MVDVLRDIGRESAPNLPRSFLCHASCETGSVGKTWIECCKHFVLRTTGHLWISMAMIAVVVMTVTVVVVAMGISLAVVILLAVSVAAVMLGRVAQSAAFVSSCNLRNHVHQKGSQHYSACQAVEVAHHVLHPAAHLLPTGHKATDVFSRGACRERVLSGVRREGKLDQPWTVAKDNCEEEEKAGGDELGREEGNVGKV